MSNNKQSSIEWYAKQIDILHYDYFTEHISKDEKNQRLKQLKQQAKAMHKQEITKAFDFGDYNIDLPDGTWEKKYKSAEQYHNETFGGNNE